MKLFPQSIRWRLQLWYGILLVIVLAAFGITANRLENSRQLRQVDEELQQRLSTVAGALRPFPFREPGGPGSPGPGPGPASDGERRRLPPPRPGEGETRLDEPMRRGPPQRRELRLTPEDQASFDRGGARSFYYAVWIRDGKLLARSESAPMPIPPPRRSRSGPSPTVRMRGELRESYLFSGPGECILVGRSMAPDLAEMRRRGWWLTGIGLGVLALGLAGGWWLASRAIRPIEAISSTAARISGGDLTQRIRVSETESELGRLANVLNSTFARLEAAFGQQAQFTSDAAHELRTPLTVMLTQAQMALSRERTAPEYRETVEACLRAAQRMRRLIESLLELARLDAGQEPIQSRPLDLATVINDCVELVRPLAATRDVTLTCGLPSIQCQGDAGRLGQVFTNLLTNAIQYNHAGGQVRVSGQVTDGLATIEVADTGAGISTEDLPHVFERFYRADKARTGGGNAGLGLAISKAIVEAHGGAIEATSELGAGTTIAVRLPVA